MYDNRALLGDEKAKLGLSLMYDPPPGAKKEKVKEDDEPEFKFGWQREYNAPREAYVKGDDAITDSRLVLKSVTYDVLNAVLGII